jgi:RNA polymerase sigma factor (sigma-70 family)
MISPFDTLPKATITTAAERDLAVKFRATGDESALEALVLNNMRQAVLYARRVCHDIFEDGELISVCYRALLRQAKRYDPSSRLAFFTFAKIGVRGDVNRHFRQLDTLKNSKRVHLPDWADSTGAGHEDVADCSETVAQNDEAQFVLRSIRRCCTEREQVIFALAYYGCLGFHEIARLLGVSRAAIQASHARALQKVRSDCRKTERLLFDENSRA